MSEKTGMLIKIISVFIKEIAASGAKLALSIFC